MAPDEFSERLWDFAVQELFAHFGPGNALTATLVTVEWPSGTQCSFRNVSADQALTILEPSLRGAQTANGQIELTAFADLDRPSKVEVSTDLVTWSLLVEFTGQGDTPVTVTDPNAPGQNQRFHRMK